MDLSFVRSDFARIIFSEYLRSKCDAYWVWSGHAHSTGRSATKEVSSAIAVMREKNRVLPFCYVHGNCINDNCRDRVQPGLLCERHCRWEEPKLGTDAEGNVTERGAA